MWLTSSTRKPWQALLHKSCPCSHFAGSLLGASFILVKRVTNSEWLPLARWVWREVEGMLRILLSESRQQMSWGQEQTWERVESTRWLIWWERWREKHFQLGKSCWRCYHGFLTGCGRNRHDFLESWEDRWEWAGCVLPSRPKGMLPFEVRRAFRTAVQELGADGRWVIRGTKCDG